MPPACMQLVQTLYDHNRCRISCKGALYDGFGIQAGIRQGCPLSPLLFAVAVDLLLRRLARTQSASCLRAFADDIGMVVPSFYEAGQMLMSTF
eukprot:10585283-Karenia_brevis.AAC.1